MIELGPFVVTPEGVLSLRCGAATPMMRFDWKGRACAAWLEADRLRLKAQVGRIPSTAEPDADRERTFAALAGLPAGLPPGWRLRLAADHSLFLEAEAQVAGTAPALVAAMVRFALALDPYLETVESAGAGRLNT